LLAHHLARLGVVRQPFEHRVELARLLAGRDRGAVDLGEGGRKVPQSIGERMPLDHLAAHAEHDPLHARFFGLFGDRLQRLLERQTRAQQGRELARQKRQVERG
jgi:hypothetical protein